MSSSDTLMKCRGGEGNLDRCVLFLGVGLGETTRVWSHSEGVGNYGGTDSHRLSDGPREVGTRTSSRITYPSGVWSDNKHTHTFRLKKKT